MAKSISGNAKPVRFKSNSRSSSLISRKLSANSRSSQCAFWANLLSAIRSAFICAEDRWCNSMAGIFGIPQLLRSENATMANDDVTTIVDHNGCNEAELFDGVRDLANLLLGVLHSIL